jgi:hypothetical protein
MHSPREQVAARPIEAHCAIAHAWQSSLVTAYGFPPQILTPARDFSSQRVDEFAEGVGAGEKSRTPDLRITNALLYQLSYAGVAIDRLRDRRASGAF